MRPRPSLRAVALLALVAAAALAGCARPGDDATDSPGPSPSSSSPAASTDASLTPTFPGNLPVGEGTCVVVVWEGRPLEPGAPEGAAGDAAGDAADEADNATHNGTVAFRIGSGHSGLGTDVERALLGHTAGDAVEVDSEDDAARRPGSATLGRRFGPFDAEQPWDLVPFRLANPHVNLSSVQPGDPVEHHPWEPYYNATYVRHNESHVVLRYHPVDGRMFRLGDYPIHLRTHVADDGSWREEYVTDVGAAFRVPPAPSYSCRTDFHLPPGNYTVAAVRTDDLLLHFEPALPPDLQGPAHFRLHVVDYAA